MLFNFFWSFTLEPSFSVTVKTSTNQPPSELIRALRTFRPSSVKCITTCRTTHASEHFAAGNQASCPGPCEPANPGLLDGPSISEASRSKQAGCAFSGCQQLRTSTRVPALLAENTDTVVVSPWLTSTVGGWILSSKVSYL